jgi:carbamoyl-phosphate synthase large subunit
MITAAGGPAGFCLAKYLSGKAVLIGVDSSADSPAQFFCDDMYKVPFSNAPGYEEEIYSVIRQVGPDIIVPTFDEDLLCFDRIRSRIDSFILLSPGETIRICDNKRKTSETFQDIAARTYSAIEARKNKTSPVFIRPVKGRGSKDGFKVENEADMDYALRKIKEPFIQEWLPGPEVTVDTFADLEGKLLGIAPRIRVETRGGISTKGQFVHDEQIADACRIIHERLRIIGPANIQFMMDGNGMWKLLEINPRYSGGIGLSYTAGFDSITPLLTLDAKHRILRADRMKPDYGITVVRYWDERVIDG